MKRILLLITCLAVPAAQSMQQPNLKTVGRPIPGAARAVTGAALLNLAWTLIKYARTPARGHAMVQTDAVPLTSEIQEQLTELRSMLQQLRDQQQATIASDAITEPDSNLVELQQTIATLATQVQQLSQQQQQDWLTPELAALREHIQQLTAQQATSAAEASVPADFDSELLQEQRDLITRQVTAMEQQTSAIQQLHTNLEASQRCNRWIGRGVGAAVTLYAILYFIASQITPVYPT